MQHTIVCRSCNKRNTIPEGSEGRSFKCAHCQEKFTVPAPSAEPEPAQEDEFATIGKQATKQRASARRKGTGSTGRQLLVLAVLIALGLVAGGGWYFGHHKPSQRAAHEADVEFSNYSDSREAFVTKPVNTKDIDAMEIQIEMVKEVEKEMKERREEFFKTHGRYPRYVPKNKR